MCFLFTHDHANTGKKNLAPVLLVTKECELMTQNQKRQLLQELLSILRLDDNEQAKTTPIPVINPYPYGESEFYDNP